MTRAVVAFGRMNPPTVGHEKLAKKVSDEARKRKAMPHIYLSHSQDKKKNPLNYNDKIKYATKAFGKMVTKSSARSIIEVFKELEKMDHTEVVLVAGSDRIKEFNTLLQKYNGKEYNFKKIEVISAGERDPDSEGVEGMSGTKLRGLAKSGDFGTFKTGLASKLRDADKKKVYNIIRSVVEEVSPKQLSDLEKFGDRILAKFSVDITFSRHFADRMNDARNKPEIKIAELQALFKKIAKKKAVDIKKYPNAEVVLKDIQKDLNLPIAIKVDKDGTLEVVHKTIMRKKNFGTPNPVISYESLEEGVNDPGIFKAVFLAGGPGSGKSFIVGNTGLSSFGLKLVNVDDVFEKALKKAGLDTSPENIMSPKGQEIRGKSKKITVNKESTYLKGRLGLIIDGTGKNFNKINAHAKLLKKMGYETAMIFVNTNLETALDRNKKRPRTLPDKNVEKMWKSVQDNIGKFQNSFGINFTIVDNSEGVDWESNALNAYKKISKWVKMSPSSKIAKNWISQEKSRRGINESFEVYLEEKNAEKSGDFGRFKTGLASKLGDTDKMKSIIHSVNEDSDEEEDDDEYDDISDFPDTELKKTLDTILPGLIDDEEEDEDAEVDEDRAPLTLQQRMKRKMLMKKLAPKMARKRAMAMKRKAGTKQLELRARKAAIMILRKKVAGPKGAKYATLSPAEKMGIDKRVAKKMPMVGKIAKKLLPIIRKKEIARFDALNKKEEFTGTTLDINEEFTNYMFEQFIHLEEKSIVDLEEKSITSGVSFSIIREVYRRGMESYESNKRPDTTPQQWAYARVNSYLAGGKTDDADLAKDLDEEFLALFKEDQD